MTVTGGVVTSDIESTTAHIHQGAAGVSGLVLVTLVKITDTQRTVPANTKLTAEQCQSYKAGDLYVNVHSAAHRDGEIRMLLKPKARNLAMIGQGRQRFSWRSCLRWSTARIFMETYRQLRMAEFTTAAGRALRPCT
jgi:hypothetical protein